MASCKQEPRQEKPALAAAKTAADTAVKKPVNSVWGYRFIIRGDFDGDGKPENLVEHYYSRKDKKESPKFYDNIDSDDQVWDSLVKKQPYSYALSDNKNIDTLRIYKGVQLNGIAYLKNEGDLNGDGTDEVSYVTDYADMSSMNTWHIVTYKNNRWQELYSFSMRDWQLPELPGVVNAYGPLGLESKTVLPQKDTLNYRLQKELTEFPGLVKKVGTNKIQVIYINDEAEQDTMTVSLKRPK